MQPRVPGVDDFASPELSALLGLLADEAPMNMRAFSVAARVSPATARGVLDRLAGMGLVEVQKEDRGATQVLRITLTPLGQQVAQRVRDIEALLTGRARR